MGITRVANVTGLDYVGIPVVMSVRPNSRNLSTYQGKGLSLDAAKASAVMEAYEYACAEEPRQDAIGASAAALDRSRRMVPVRLRRKRLRADDEISWVIGTDLLSDRSVAVPEAVVTTDYRRPQRPGFDAFRATSNGLASGNDCDEATLHALCELIERDALALWKLAPLAHRQATRIDPRRIADASVDAVLDRYDAAAMNVDVWEITSDIGVPAFHCIIDDARGEPPFLGRFGGAGCHPNAGIAICRALCEAAQSRLTYIVGTRDDIPIDSYALVGWHRSIMNLIADPPATAAPGRAPETPSCDTATIAGDVSAVLDRLEQRGIGGVVRVDLTHGGVGLPCVRLLAPDLEEMSNKIGYRAGRRAIRAARAWA